MAADTSVKFFHSKMAGLPSLIGWSYGFSGSAAQNNFNALKALLVTGFNSQTATSFTLSGGVGVLTFASSHGFEVDTVLALSGADQGSLNGEWRVTAVTNLTVTLNMAGVTLTNSGGTFVAKYAPLGWSLLGSPTTLPATFYSTDPTGTGMAVTITYGGGSYNFIGLYVSAYRLVSSGAVQQLFASQAIPLGGNVGITGFNYSGWVLVGDTKTAYLNLHSNFDPSTSVPIHTNGGRLSGFGDFAALNSTDGYRAMLETPNTSATGNTGATNPSLDNLQATSRSGTLALSGTLGGGTPTATYAMLESLGHGLTTGYPGATANNACPSYPNGPDNSLILSRRTIGDNNGLRGYNRGLLISPQNCYSSFGALDRVTGTGAYAGRKLLAVKCGQDNLTATTSGPGLVFFDITGPWES